MTAIGDTIWAFDESRRVYRRTDMGGYIAGGPVWREHWRPVTITGETSRSWITGFGKWDQRKVPKKGHDPRLYAFSQEEVDRAVWIHDNRYRISQMLMRCDDYGALKTAAEAIGYKEEVGL